MSPETVNGLFALGGAALGAILTGTISWIQHSQSRERKELTISTSKPSDLVTVNDSLNGYVKIIAGGQEVETVSTMSYSISNSGNTPLSAIDVDVTIPSNSELLGGTSPSSNFNHDSKDLITHIVDRFSAKITVNFLNPGESVGGEFFFKNHPDDISINFRKLGVKTIHRKNIDAEATGILSRVVFEVVRRNFLLHNYARLTIPAYKKYLENRANEDEIF